MVRRKWFYRVQVENFDIVRNYFKQWGFLDVEIGEKLWSVIEALGVVDVEGKRSVLNKFQEAVFAEKEKKVGVKGNLSCL